nr:hypothetical protein [Tanacetum cinerariifolium]
MIAYLTKSDASEGFEQILDFLTTNDVVHLQALIDRQKVIITEATVYHALHLDDDEVLIVCPMRRYLLSWQGWETNSALAFCLTLFLQVAFCPGLRFVLDCVLLNYFIQYTQQVIREFRDTLIQHLEYVKKSINERVQLKRENDSWVNERQMQTLEEKVDTSQALDASSVDTESSRTESKEHDTSSRSGNDAHDDDADIRPIYDEEPMTGEQMTTKIDVFAIGQQHTEQLEFNNEGEVV